MASKVDVHHHVYPPVYSQALKEIGGDPSGWFVPDWTVEADLDLANTVGIKKTILSVTAPGPSCVGDSSKALSLAQDCNDYVASIRDERPQNYGFFLVLPSLFDTEACLKEIARGLDELHADGVVIYTRYGPDNTYLGNEAFLPIWKELNKRKAVVFVHPTHAVDTALVNSKMPQPMFDYPHETGRTAMDLITSGRLINDCADCKIILSHGGGTLPSLIGRVSGLLPFTQIGKVYSPDDIRSQARRFYYDTALSSDSATMKGLFEVADPTHVLFGSDFPNAPNDSIKYFTNLLKDAGKAVNIDVEDIYFKNALKMFPGVE
ncbi:amidohydrolase [Trichoderma gamsii]|uniref:6-methylsalicylate decarboxylase n=1 Tax=Trichoderma gamsii TaxID=398673 RepID=A0A2P4ZX07_9HYPO|nr:amidohydrolase [Trichoderma gamsii]PON28827.1 amidohydrolase [Trichoderma gamsii]